MDYSCWGISELIRELEDRDARGLCEPARYKCKDDECDGTATRDAKTLQEAGDPYCPKCDGDMEPV